MWREVGKWILAFVVFGFVVCLVTAAVPGFMPLLFLLPVFHAGGLMASWDDALKAWTETQ